MSDPINVRKVALMQIEEAIGSMVGSAPFFAALAMHLKPVINTGIDTACTDGVTLQINPEWFNSLDDQERTTIAAHEAMHPALGHMWRQQDRNDADFNIACDHEINLILKDAGFKLPAGGHCSDAFRNMSAEEIYALIHREPEEPNRDSPDDQQGPGQDQQQAQQPAAAGQGEGESDDDGQDSPVPGQGSGGPGDGDGEAGADGDAAGDTSSVIPKDQAGGDCGNMGSFCQPRDAQGEAMSQSDLQVLQERWEIATEQARQSVKAIGSSSADIERMAGNWKKSEVDWRQQLAEFVSCRRPTDVTWSRPNRRFDPRRLYLPSVGVPAMGPVFILCDVSGSIGQAELDATASVINGVADTTQPEFVEVVYWDTRVKRVDRFEPQDLPFKMVALGGGGTDPRAAFAHVEKIAAEEGAEPSCIIVVTDMLIFEYPPAPDWPVLWVSTTNRKGPFGQTIHLKL